MEKSKKVDIYVDSLLSSELTGTSLGDLLKKAWNAGHYEGYHECRESLEKSGALQIRESWEPLHESPCKSCDFQTPDLLIGCTRGGCQKYRRYLKDLEILEHFKK